MSEMQNLLAMTNALICAVCLFICVCRLNAMQSPARPVRRLVAAEYAVGAGAMIFSGLSPLRGEWPGYATLVVSCYILLALIASSKGWRGDKPPASASKFGPLGEQ